MAPAPPCMKFYVFRPSGRQLLDAYLVPRAGLGGRVYPGYIEEGVDVFSLRPRALPFWPNHRRAHGEVWGFFFAARPAAGKKCPGPGGCWVRYGPEKAYYGQDGDGGEAVAFRRRFAFHVTCWGDDGKVVVLPTPWLMKEYRLNKCAAALRAAAKRAQAHPRANMDCVVRKVFVKQPPPSGGSDQEELPVSSYPEEAGYSSDEDLKRVGCRIEEEPGRKRARFCLV